MSVGLLVGVALGIATAAAAAPPDAATILSQMKVALEPPRSSLRRLDLSVTGDGGETTKIVAGQARKRVDGRNRILTVVLAPADSRGISLLIQEGDEQVSDVQWAYVPFVRRVRKLTPLHDYDAFLGSDFTNADLGFADVRSKSTILAVDEINGKKAFKVETVPDDAWYYKRLVTWVDQSSMLPIQRELYGPDDDPWKLQKFEDVTKINGTPTALAISMQDQETKGRSVIKTSALKYDVKELPDDLFDPERLMKAIDAPIWGSLSAP
jgi:hypothetical protein